MKLNKQSILILTQWVIIAAMVILFFKKWHRSADVMTEQEIVSIISEHINHSFDEAGVLTLPVVTSQINDVLAAIQKNNDDITEAQRSLSKRLIETEARINNQGGELEALTAIATETRIAVAEPFVILNEIGEIMTLDSMRQMFPELFKTMLSVVHQDSSGWVDISAEFDLRSGSANLECNCRNDFTIAQYSKDGQYFVDIEDQNPYTYAVDGTQSFQLLLPTADTKIPFVVFGPSAFVGVDQNLQPVVGGGVSATIPIQRLIQLFKRD